ncbi:DUF6497 family protein [Oceaniglobus indicus]|uniref:DUF6497 family protein n=1 Tax=Oceaniglobus indicus TaxID=2047749 RepID=UPI000C181120|nr:DUF6497 family protein [Oceaniglobus indicus]
MLACAGPVWGAVDQPIAVPSRTAVVFHDILRAAPGIGLTYRFRFVAPGIAAGVSFDDAVTDMAHLCETYALPRLSEIGPVPAQVIISVSDQPVVFGEITPEVTQYFEGYRPEGDRCVWEGF